MNYDLYFLKIGIRLHEGQLAKMGKRKSANAKVCYDGRGGGSLLKIYKYKNPEMILCVHSCQMLRFLELVVKNRSLLFKSENFAIKYGKESLKKIVMPKNHCSWQICFQREFPNSTCYY